jgi:Mg/Co/Ni transporter MgtE
MDSPSDIVIFRTDPELKRQFQTICHYHRTTMTRELIAFMAEWIRSKSVEKIRSDDEFEEAFGLPLGFNSWDE